MFLIKVIFWSVVLVTVLCNTVEDTKHKQVLWDDFPSQDKSMCRLVTVICGLRGVGLTRCCLNGEGVMPVPHYNTRGIRVYFSPRSGMGLSVSIHSKDLRSFSI